MPDRRTSADARNAGQAGEAIKEERTFIIEPEAGAAVVAARQAYLSEYHAPTSPASVPASSGPNESMGLNDTAGSADFSWPANELALPNPISY